MKTGNWTDKGAAIMAKALLKLQQKFATVMDNCFSKMTRTQQRSTLIACLIISVILCASIILASIVSTPVAVAEQNRMIPVLQQKETRPVITKDIFESMRKYRAYMDSSKQTIPPSLLDSIRLVERIYHSQK